MILSAFFLTIRIVYELYAHAVLLGGGGGRGHGLHPRGRGRRCVPPAPLESPGLRE